MSVFQKVTSASLSQGQRQRIQFKGDGFFFPTAYLTGTPIVYLPNGDKVEGLPGNTAYYPPNGYDWIEIGNEETAIRIITLCCFRGRVEL